jgi:hypothetical protein
VRSFNKIFQIGFSRCGTTSIHDFFLQNGLKSTHCIVPNSKFSIRNHIIYNYKSNKRLLSGLEDYDCFTDFMNLAFPIPIEKILNLINIQYPGSKFIYNLRNVEDWLMSLQTLYIEGSVGYNGKLRKFYGKQFKTTSEYINYRYGTFMNDRNLNFEQLLQLWVKEWSNRLYTVRNYFKNNPSDIVFFDIDTEQDKFNSFMNSLLNLKIKNFPHSNKSKS